MNDKSIIVALLNEDSKEHSITVSFDKIGLTLTTKAGVRDLINHEERGSFVGSFAANVASHGTAVVRIAPQ